MFNKKIILFAGLLACIASVPGCQASPSVPNAAAIGSTSAAEKNKPPVDRSSGVGKLGGPALPLTVQEWIKGQPVDVLRGTNICVLVFCTLSRANDFALTNLTALQKMYRDKGVVVVAISDEPAEQLKEFVQIKGAKIGFTVAADDTRRTTTSYQQTFQQAMLPRAFIVGKDGNVLWQGHPLRDGLGDMLDEITSGRYNPEQTQKNIIATTQMDQYLAMARQADTNSMKAGRMLLAIRANDAALLCDLAAKIANDQFITKPDIALANAALDRAEQLATTNATGIAVNRATLQMEKYLVLARQDDTNSVMEGQTLLTIRTNDAVALCDLAFKIATDPFIANRDVILANAALDRAEQLGATNITDIGVDRAILLFQTGKEEAGLARARQALASAKSQDEKDEAQTCIHAMEVRLAAAKTNQITAPVTREKTNQVTSPTSKP